MRRIKDVLAALAAIVCLAVSLLVGAYGASLSPTGSVVERAQFCEQAPCDATPVVTEKVSPGYP